MAKEITGDLLRDGRGVLCHQVNFQGVMGGGIAASIRRILPPKTYDRYVRYCLIHGADAMGKVLWLHLPDTGRVIANMFSQRDWTGVAREDSADAGGLTDYAAMEKCFKAVRTYALRYKLPVYIPGYIGCGIAGGDWNRVKVIIDNVFKSSSVETTIVYWEKEAGRSFTVEDEVDYVPF